MGGRNDGRRLHGNGELRERSSFIRSRSLRTHPRRAGLAVAMVTGKPSHAPARRKAGAGRCVRIPLGITYGGEGPWTPRRPAAPPRGPSRAAGAAQSGRRRGTSGRTPCTWVHSHELLGWPVPVDRWDARRLLLRKLALFPASVLAKPRCAHPDPTACDCVTSHGKRDYETLQPGRRVGGWPQDGGSGSELQAGGIPKPEPRRPTGDRRAPRWSRGLWQRLQQRDACLRREICTEGPQVRAQALGAGGRHK
ncbi:zinc finger protein 837 isoform X7 [Manis javanica]|uniref:zinc finger protein 837 isoform X7 n=1 Tax=Manis javanica TaxID=9974 RepID=UPI003C6CE331